jgi:hypothetical protein
MAVYTALAPNRFKDFGGTEIALSRTTSQIPWNAWAAGISKGEWFAVQ